MQHSTLQQGSRPCLQQPGFCSTAGSVNGRTLRRGQLKQQRVNLNNNSSRLVARASESERSAFLQQGRAWLDSLLHRFSPMSQRADQVSVLDFEKPLLELDKRIKEVRKREGGGWDGRWRTNAHSPPTHTHTLSCSLTHNNTTTHSGPQRGRG